MKRTSILLISLLLLLALCASSVLFSCQDSPNEPDETTTQEATQPTSNADTTGLPTTTETIGEAVPETGSETGAVTDTKTETESETEMATVTEAETETETETEMGSESETVADTETETELETETEVETMDLGISADALNEWMSSLYTGTEVKNETVMFLDAGEEKSLMFRADSILSVTSYDGKIVYTEGVDYELRDGKLVALEGGSLPIITSAVYYGADSSSFLMTSYNGKNVYTYWGEGTVMTNWQVNVSYTHSDGWEDFLQECEIEHFTGLIDKLKAGEDVTLIFYGDSITYGASASFIYGYAPFRYSYPLLFAEALADLFDYNIHYVRAGLTGTSGVPGDRTVDGARGTITYVNPAVGGWNTQNGLDNYDTYVKPFIEQYGCDLFVLAFGMNDAGAVPRTLAKTQKSILEKVLADDASASLLVVSTMVPNPDATNGWYGNQVNQEKALESMVSGLQKDGVPCAVACMGSTSRAILKHKNFRDYTGNNINHPNDFFCRVYAQCLLQTLIGYENMG